MATRVIDDSKLQNIAVAIQGKDGGGQMTVDEMPTRIAAIPTGEPIVQNPALALMDWEGTILKEYSKEDALALTELPAPSSLSKYANVDHELLLFQKWTRNLTNIKTWIQNHKGGCLDVGAIYTTTDGQDYNYWGNPRLDTANTITMQKRGTASIRSSAFSSCYSLTQINIPDSVTSIGSSAFSYCYSLTQINIPDSVTSIGSSAFSYCHSLTQINIPDGVTSIRDYAFRSCYSLTRINIPNSVTSITLGVFRDCHSLTQINIPDGVTIIDNSVFQNCYSLTQINLHDRVGSIVTYAFKNCYSLTQINIPKGMWNIGLGAFYNCKTLCDIFNESKSPLVSADAFDGLPTNYRIYVPRTNLSWFETATNWSTIYTQSHIVTIEDNIEYLESLGFNVDKYKEAA